MNLELRVRSVAAQYQGYPMITKNPAVSAGFFAWENFVPYYFIP